MYSTTLPKTHLFDWFNSTGTATTAVPLTPVDTGPTPKLKSLAISGNIVPGWSLRTPIILSIEVDELGSFLVSSEYLLTHGIGDNLKAATKDFTEMLIEQYAGLVESEKPLSKRLELISTRIDSILSRD